MDRLELRHGSTQSQRRMTKTISMKYNTPKAQTFYSYLIKIMHLARLAALATQILLSPQLHLMTARI